MKRLLADGRKRRRFELTVTKIVIGWAVALALYLWILSVTGWGKY